MEDIRKKDLRVLLILIAIILIPIIAGFFFKMVNDKSSMFWKTTVLSCERKQNLGMQWRMEVRIKESKLPKPLASPGTIFLKSLDITDREGISEILQAPLEESIMKELLEYNEFAQFLRRASRKKGLTYGTREEAVEDFDILFDERETIVFLNPWRREWNYFFTAGTLLVTLDRYTGRMEFQRDEASCKKKDKLF